MAKKNREPLPSEDRLMRLLGVKTVDELEKELNLPDPPLSHGWQVPDDQYALNEKLEKESNDLRDLQLLSRLSPPPE